MTQNRGPFPALLDGVAGTAWLVNRQNLAFLGWRFEAFGRDPVTVPDTAPIEVFLRDSPALAQRRETLDRARRRRQALARSTDAR